MLPPDVLQLDLTKEQAWVNLVVSEKPPPFKIIADSAQELDHLFCEVCTLHFFSIELSAGSGSVILLSVSCCLELVFARDVNKHVRRHMNVYDNLYHK